MEHWEIMMIAFGVSMDAFAVSLGKGLCVLVIGLKILIEHLFF